MVKRVNEDEAFQLPSEKTDVPLKRLVLPYIESGAYGSFHVGVLRIGAPERGYKSRE